VAFRTAVVDRGFRWLNSFHRGVVALTRGRLGRRAFGMEIIELITVGRRSSRPHSTMLTVPVIDGDALVLVASKGGDHRDPDWLKNIVANPMVRVTLRSRSIDMHARVASGEEHAQLWPRVVARYSHYENYQRRAGREIALVICTPVPSEA
jgi:deazaflavin-dependent oxidoreductase (nitroreductase family)